MDSCHTKNISLGYDMTGRIHFVLGRGNKKKLHWTRDSSSSQNTNLAIHNCAC